MLMTTIMKVSSSSGKEFLEVESNDDNYTLKNQQGVTVAKRSKDDEVGVTSLMEFINNLTENYGWKTENLV